MKLILGLGNPGNEYKHTRHNVGFLFIDYLKEKLNFEDFKLEKKFKAQISLGEYNGQKTILVKPETYMNLSGESIIKIMSFYKIDKKDIVIISDDVSMIFGKVRHRQIGSAGGHNGLKSIIGHIGQDFSRIKIGLGNDIKYNLSNWVLGKFTPEELKQLEDIFPEVENLLSEII